MAWGPVMDLSKLTFFTLAKRKMDWLSQRQEVLAQNVANADTPRYRTNDVRPIDFKKVMRAEMQMSRETKPTLTHPNHQPSTIPEKGQFQVDAERRAYETNPDGNSVVIEDQMFKVSEVKGQYDLALNLYQKQIRFIKVALGKNG